MADAKKCDRCGEFYEPYIILDGKETCNKIRLQQESIDGMTNYTFGSKDLCPDCMEVLKSFINGDENAHIPNVRFTDKDHVWILNERYISLKRVNEMLKENANEKDTM